MSNSTVQIPELITVHLGEYDDSSKDVTIPFPDYIMNVASSSLNPNWPESLLTANIYQIISDTLSRIGEGRYREMGHDFDITENEFPPYRYVDGHVIYNNIRTLAGDLYNNYLIRGDSREPLSEEGMGEKINSPESFALAEEDKNHLDILRAVYDDDTIDIVHNAPAEKENQNPPVFPIAFDDSGNNVRNIQIQLNRVSTHYPTIPKIILSDGIFSYDTQAAVEEFQRIFGLEVTGIVDQATWYTLLRVYSAINKLNTLYSEGIMHDMNTRQFPGVLSPGDSGDSIHVLQHFINYLSQYYRTIPPVESNGIFDALTLAAVVDMQRTLGLSPTGFVDAETWDIMFDAYLGITQMIPPKYTDGSSLPFDGTDLRLGSEGERVRLLQEYLSYISSIYPEIPGVQITGYFGIRLQEAVVSVQRLLGIPYTGVVDERTWNAIASLYTDLYMGAQLQEGQYPGFDIGVPEEGYTPIRTETAIRDVQRCLHAISQNDRDIAPLVIDGIFNGITRESVTSFQIKSGLDPTGIVDRKTWDMLFEAYYKELRKTLPLPSVSIFPSNPPGYEVKLGDTGYLVTMVQYLLQEISRDFDFNPPVKVTGSYDEATEMAVKAFQKKNMLEETGVVCTETWRRLAEYHNMMQHEYLQ